MFRIYLFHSLRFLLFICLCSFTTAAEIVSGEVQTRNYYFEKAQKDMQYALYVPESYQTDIASPLIVLLHGAGGTPQGVIRYEGIQQQAEEHGYIVVAPYGYNELGWYGLFGSGKSLFNNGAAGPIPDNIGELSEADVINVLEIVRSEFNIDSNRTYLMGHSMGGGGTYHIGTKYSENWAALALLAPAIFGKPDLLDTITDMPVFVAHGDADSQISVDVARRLVAKMEELNMTHQYIEIAGGDHNDAIARNPELIAQVFDFLNKYSK